MRGKNTYRKLYGRFISNENELQLENWLDGVLEPSFRFSTILPDFTMTKGVEIPISLR